MAWQRLRQRQRLRVAGSVQACSAGGVAVCASARNARKVAATRQMILGNFDLV